MLIVPKTSDLLLDVEFLALQLSKEEVIREGSLGFF
jgi:hypothetical protein